MELLGFSAKHIFSSRAAWACGPPRGRDLPAAARGMPPASKCGFSSLCFLGFGSLLPPSSLFFCCLISLVCRACVRACGGGPFGCFKASVFPHAPGMRFPPFRRSLFSLASMLVPFFFADKWRGVLPGCRFICLLKGACWGVSFFLGANGFFVFWKWGGASGR